MIGVSRLQHEIGVCFEFARAGVCPRVAIECKDWKRLMLKGQILEFEVKVRDVGSITGADISTRRANILPLCFDDIPSMGVLTA